jgi:hypothetical protein
MLDSSMPETDERDEVVVSGEVYRIARMTTEDGARITVSSRDQLRFSLPLDTPDEQVRRFIQVYALGFADGQSTRPAGIEGHIRERLTHAAHRLGRAAGKLKADRA